MFNKVVVALIVAAGMAAIGSHADVQAKIEKALGLTKEPPANLAAQFSPVSCEGGAALIEQAGYTHVNATKCSGIQYRYNAFYGKREFSVIFNATGHGIIAVAR